MKIFEKINDGLGVRNSLIRELKSAGEVLLSVEHSDCSNCGECSSCEIYWGVNWDELSLFFNVDDDVRAVSFFNEPSYVDGALSFFERAREIEELGEVEFASFLIGVPGLFDFLDRNYFDGLDGVEMDAMLDAIADVVKGGTIEEAELFFGGSLWNENFWLREYFYERGGDSVKWTLLEEEVGKARERLFYDVKAVEEFSLDDLMDGVYSYDDPQAFYPISPIGKWGSVWEEVPIGSFLYPVDLELSGDEYPFKFSPDAIASLASISDSPASVLEGLIDGAGLTAGETWKVWPWFYGIDALYGVVVSAVQDDGIGARFFKEAFGDDFFQARDEWYYTVLIDWLKHNRVSWGTREENDILLEIASSESLDLEGAELILDALSSFRASPDVYRALAGNYHAPLSLLEDFASDRNCLGVPELGELARDAIDRKMQEARAVADRKKEYIGKVLSGEVELPNYTS